MADIKQVFEVLERLSSFVGVPPPVYRAEPAVLVGTQIVAGPPSDAQWVEIVEPSNKNKK